MTVSFSPSSRLTIFCFPTFPANFEKVLNSRCYFLVILVFVLEVAAITDLVKVGKHHLLYR